jgi:hypothetical protein
MNMEQEMQTQCVLLCRTEVENFGIAVMYMFVGMSQRPDRDGYRTSEPICNCELIRKY